MSDVALRFGASDDGLTAQFRKVDRQLESFQNTTAKVATNIGRGFSNLGTIVGGISFGLLIRESLQLADSLEKVSAQTGISVEAVQKLQFVAAQSSVSFEAVSGAVNRLQKALVLSGEGSAEATAALGRLGISVNEIVGLAPDEQFLKVAQSISAIKDPAQQTTAALAIFGRGGGELLPILKQTAEETDKMVAGFAGIGGAISGDTNKAVDDLGDSLGNVKTAVVSLGVELLGLVSGPLTTAATKIGETIGALRFVLRGSLGDNKQVNISDEIIRLTGRIEYFRSVMETDPSARTIVQQATEDVARLTKELEKLQNSGAVAVLSGRGPSSRGRGFRDLGDLSTAPKTDGNLPKKATAAVLTPEERRIQAQNESAATINVDDYQIQEVANQTHLDELIRQQEQYVNRRFETESSMHQALTSIREQFGIQEIDFEQFKAASIQEVGASVLQSGLEIATALFGQNKKVAIAVAAINIGEAATKALTLPFPGNLAAVSKVLSIGATLSAKIRSASIGGSTSVGGAVSAGGSGFSQATLPDAPQAKGAETRAQTNIYLSGNFAGPRSAEWIVDTLRDELGRDVTFFGSNSRQAFDSMGAG